MLARLSPILQMIRKEFVQAFRDPRMRRLLMISPIIQTLLFGYVVSTDVRNIPTAIYDLDNSFRSRDLVSRFVSSKYFQVVAYIHSDEEALQYMNHATAQAILRINHGFQNNLNGGKTGTVQVILDGTDSNATGIVLNYAATIANQYNRDLQTARGSKLYGLVPTQGGVELRERVWFNENLESRNFFLPGVIAMILLLTTMTMSSMAIVREKEIGTIEQIIVTPITRFEFILGKMIPFALIGLANAVSVALVTILWFQVPFRGNPIMLLAGMLLFIYCTLGFGLLLSTISQTQQQAMMGTFFFNNPLMMLSGFLFPIENMPRPIQVLTYLNPLRYFILIVRGVFLKGVGLNVLWPQFLALAILGSAILSFAVQRFKKTAS